MKQLLTLTLVTLSIFGLTAQTDTTEYIDIGADYEIREIETFSNSTNRMHHGRFLAVDAHYGQIENEDAIFAGFKGGYIMNRSLELGFAVYGFHSEIEHEGFKNNDVDVFGGLGGLHIAPVLFPIKQVHVAFPIFFEAGAVGYDDDSRFGNQPDNFKDDYDRIFVMQGGVNLVFNITRSFQIELSSRYMKTSDIELEQIQRLSLDGFT